MSLDDNSLAREIFETQRKYKFPGLINECSILIEYLDLPNIIKELKFKQLHQIIHYSFKLFIYSVGGITTQIAYANPLI